ncbi:hypothetical protein HOK51_09170 [Candidatus Woesearchaeota archaeon]|jgi:hypothetical protein|nr:hypothetical protein [Candidatus Woesearchaeota archaeon]MBT6520000.1 hypothetical protein [Candidatus Woesearchaeota archaeon]MBT7367753.1 hypothetical protein [Candidatus Woesearchaeota archaeon]
MGEYETGDEFSELDLDLSGIELDDEARTVLREAAEFCAELGTDVMRFGRLGSRNTKPPKTDLLAAKMYALEQKYLQQAKPGYDINN